MNDEVYFWHAGKHWSLPQVDTIILGVCNNRHWSLLQGDTIVLGVCNQACPNYLEKEVCISLQYFQKFMEGEVNFLPANEH